MSYIYYCPKCKSILNNDERASGKCFDCGASFSDKLSGDTNANRENSSIVSSRNVMGGILKWIGILILISGTIGSFIIAGGNKYRYKFSFEKFLLPEVGTIITGMMFLGFSEIIQLLDDIKNRLK